MAGLPTPFSGGQQSGDNAQSGFGNGLPDWFLKSLGIGGGLGQAAGGIAGLFGVGGKNPANAASKYLDQIPGAIKPYYDPYINAGKGALDELGSQYGQLTNDTGEVYNRLAGGYKQSPGYQERLRQGLSAVDNAAAAGGQLGGLSHQRLSAETQEGLASQDYENYLNHVLGLYGKGLEGYGDINKMGYGASTGYGNELGSNLAQKAQNAFAGQQFKNQQKSGGWGNLFGGIASALPYLFL